VSFLHIHSITQTDNSPSSKYTGKPLPVKLYNNHHHFYSNGGHVLLELNATPASNVNNT